MLIAIAYLCIGIGWGVTVGLLSNQNDDLEQQAEEVALIAGAYCEVIRAPEFNESVMLDQVAIAPDVDLSTACQAIFDRVQDAD